MKLQLVLGALVAATAVAGNDVAAAPARINMAPPFSPTMAGASHAAPHSNVISSQSLPALFQTDYTTTRPGYLNIRSSPHVCSCAHCDTPRSAGISQPPLDMTPFSTYPSGVGATFNNAAAAGATPIPSRNVAGVPIFYGVEKPSMYAAPSLAMSSRTMYGVGIGAQNNPWHY